MACVVVVACLLLAGEAFVPLLAADLAADGAACAEVASG